MRESKDRTFLQCTNCGEVYQVEQEYDIESLYINSCCPHCEHKRALVCGNSLDDIYELYDPVLDKRFY